MFFYKKKYRKRNKSKSKVFDISPCVKKKERKRFGLTQNEMDDLILNLMIKERPPIISIR